MNEKNVLLFINASEVIVLLIAVTGLFINEKNILYGLCSLINFSAWNQKT